MKHDNFAFDRVGVDGTAVLSLIFPFDVSYLEVPFFDVGPHYAESGVIYHSPVLIGQRDGVVIQPGHLKTGINLSCFQESSSDQRILHLKFTCPDLL